MSKRVLIFAPHGSWTVHHQLDAVIGAALHIRGCEVKALTCDGVFKDCYVAGIPSVADACQACAQQAGTLFKSFEIPTLSMGTLLRQADFEDAREWADSIPIEELSSATFAGQPLGSWLGHAMHGYFKTGRLDYSNAEVVRVHRSYLQNAFLISKAHARVLERFRPDHVICFGGANVYYRIFFELTRHAGISVLVHERGLTDDSFLLLNNRTTYTMSCQEFEEWRNWERVPLNKRQWVRTNQLMQDRETGKNTNFIQFQQTGAGTVKEDIIMKLGLPVDRPLVALFCSGDWEFGMLKSHGQLESTFHSQTDLILEMAEVCRKEGFSLVVRHHPLGAGTKTYPRGNEFLVEMYQLNLTLGEHVRVIMPAGRISSYSLLWNADAAVSAMSTIGAEALFRGVTSVCTAESLYKPMGMAWVRRRQDLRGAVREAVDRQTRFNVADLTKAYRYAHFLYGIALGHRFKSVGFRNVYQPNIRITHRDDLAPGRDPALDRVCEHIISGSSLYQEPQGETDPKHEAGINEQQLSHISKTRAQIRQARQASIRTATPHVRILAVKRNGGASQGQESNLVLSLRRSWYSNNSVEDLPEFRGTTLISWLGNLEQILSRTSAPYALVMPSTTILDEGALSAAMEALENEAPREPLGCRLGFYLHDEELKKLEEMFTTLNDPTGFDEAVSLIPQVADPLVLLSSIVWRREGLREMCRSAMQAELETSIEFSESLFHYIRKNRDQGLIVSTNMPVMFLTSSRRSVLREDSRGPLVGDNKIESQTRIPTYARHT